jgi:hypothetical protein
MAEQTVIKLTDLQERTASLRSIESSYERLLTVLNKKETLKGEEAVLLEKLKAQKHIGHNRPRGVSHPGSKAFSCFF